jgi:hypothetical protein
MDGACVDVRGVLVRQPFFCLDSLSQLAPHVGTTGTNCKNKLIYFSVGLIVYKQNPTKNVFAKKNRHTHKSKWNERIQHEHRIARANRHCWIKVVMGCLSFVFSGVLKLNWRKIKSKPWVIIYVQTVIRWSCRTLWYRWIRTMLRIGNGIVQSTQFFHWWREPYSSRALPAETATDGMSNTSNWQIYKFMRKMNGFNLLYTVEWWPLY